MTRGLVVAGTGSGVGKTTVTLGLMGALRRKGLAVAPFKAGPDFIDPGLHRLAAGRPSRNLDTWMMAPGALAAAFARGCAGADVAVVEGVMGLFDGALGRAEAGTTAHLAKRLGLPVVLVVDARGMAGSAAAVVKGFACLDPRLTLAGVVLNRVASDSHLGFLKDAIEGRAGVPVLGHLMRDEGLAIPERHLGLTTAEDLGPGGPLDVMAERMAAGVDLDRLLALAAPCGGGEVSLPRVPRPRLRLGVARDVAFCFCYPDTLERLAEAGVAAVPFSPLADPALPPDLDGLYLPGGYPELHAAALAANAPMRAAVAKAAGAGLPVYAECGGLMYLSRGIHDAEGAFHPMCGVLPAECRMGTRRAALGYREVTVTEAGPLGPAGARLKGHEFHYSQIDADALARAGVATTLSLARRGGGSPQAEGWRVGRTWATYAHVMLTRAAARAWARELARGTGAAGARRAAGGAGGAHPVC
jgi:cobyrinic acid a,c-diamide synthase